MKFEQVKKFAIILSVGVITFGIIWSFGHMLGIDVRNGERTPSLCHLANVGYAVTNGEETVLMDAFFREGYPEDQPMSDEMREALETASPPYNTTKLITVSHAHIDHFSAPALIRHMEANPDAHVLMPTEAADAFFAAGGGEGYENRVHVRYPERSRPESVTIAGLDVTIYNLDHRVDVQNIGVLLELGGKTFFHMGDFASADTRENALDGLLVDYLLVPYWYFLAEENLALIENSITAQFIVPTHIPRPDAPAEFQERIGGRDALMTALQAAGENVLVMYDEGACVRAYEE